MIGGGFFLIFVRVCVFCEFFVRNVYYVFCVYLLLLLFFIYVLCEVFFFVFFF